MAEGGVGMEIESTDWWYNQLKELSNTYELQAGMQADQGYWWYNKVQDLLYKYDELVLEIHPQSGHWWKRLAENLLGKSCNCGQWWNREVQQLLENFVFVWRKMLLGIGDSWCFLLQDEFTEPYFIKLCKDLHKERENANVYPSPEKVFSWTRYCDVDEVKVVIVGQDPYYNPGEADGLCFSASDTMEPNIPDSLRMIFQELEFELTMEELMQDKYIVEFKRPNHGSLIGWAEQGVLLLNCCLTVREGQPKSHFNLGWYAFIKKVISLLITREQNIVFMLWGSEARKIENDFVDRDPVLLGHKHQEWPVVLRWRVSGQFLFFVKKERWLLSRILKAVSVSPTYWMLQIPQTKHEFLQASHPGTQSYKRSDKPFHSCNHFSLCNQYLSRSWWNTHLESSKKQIKWNSL